VITSVEVSEMFVENEDYIEYYVYDANQNLIYVSDENFTDYSIIDNLVSIDPIQNIETVGYEEGTYYTVYNFLTNLLGSSRTRNYYISQISSDRTELRLTSFDIPPSEVIRGVNDLVAKIQSENYYYDFNLNLGNNRLLICTNIQLDTSDSNFPTVLIKLYEPLPLDVSINTKIWVVDRVADSIAYNLQLTTIFEEEDTYLTLRSPNFNIAVSNQTSNTVAYKNQINLKSTTSAIGSGSLQYKLNSLLEEKGIEINVDYSSYSNFVHFSSAQRRLENFYYKLTLIEQYQGNIIPQTAGTYNSQSNALWENRINDIITYFDGYEYYLYYTSESSTWPKTTDTSPYVNASTNSPQALEWLAGQLSSASFYDDNNKDNLLYTLPGYLRDDPANTQGEYFVQMLGQHFDIVWTYTKDITNKYNADNRLDHGISKDLVADTLRDLGIKIYENNFSSQNLYSALLGVTPSGSLFNIPDLTTTLPAASGLQYITSYVSASSTSSLTPLDDANKEIYKRIYHNLPYLLKKKGTVAGLRSLITLYGIPDTILRINEFGGKDRNNINDWDNWQDQFNYALTTNTAQLDDTYRGIAPWKNLAVSNKLPETIEFRFKTTQFPPTYYTSSLAVFVSSSNTEYLSQGFVLEYTGSGLTSGSYSGSALDPYYQYATLKYVSESISASVYLPIYNEGWWNVGLSIISQSGAPYTASLFVKQKSEYQGDNQITYAQTSTVYLNSLPSHSSYLYLPDNTVSILTPFTYGGGKQATAIYSASFQELRYFTLPIAENVFDDHVMNPYSIEAAANTGSYNSLLYRIQMGTDLNTYYPIISSSHPAVTGSFPTNSFADNTPGYYTIDYQGLLISPNVYTTNKEFIYQDQPNAGIRIPISDKIKLQSEYLPQGNTLSPYISIQQTPVVSSSYTRDINYLEAGFSPQDEINDDIQEQLGYFNFGDYIGDPRFQSSSNTSYPDLNTLQKDYFKKYSKTFGLTDYIRLIRFFDNSLFKMIKDFVPVRTGLASGLIIKQHILERSRVRPPQASWEDQTYSGSVTTLSSGYLTGSKIYTFTGSTGGTLPYLQDYTSSGYYPPYINISQSWQEQIITPTGPTQITHNTLDEFYNGEFSGSKVTVSKMDITSPECRALLNNDITNYVYTPVLYDYNITNESTFLNNANPDSGEVFIFFIKEILPDGIPIRVIEGGTYDPTKRGTVAINITG
jgi:hypothetical protein